VDTSAVWRLHCYFGPNTEGKCLELKKILYVYLWLQNSGIYIGSMRVQPSAIYPCLYFCHGVAIAVYVDDMVMIAKTDQELNAIVKDLSKEFKVTDEGELTGFLGINVKPLEKNSSFPSQP
jgi:Reverse transcriptase (RNA-dependent DNA polymerase)